MVTKNNCSAHLPETPVCTFQKTLRRERSVQQAMLDASSIRIESCEIERGYAICTQATSEETFEYYRNLNNFELFDMQDSVARIKAKIDGYVNQDSDLGKKIKEVSKSLNDLREKLHEANNAACAMRNCLQGHLGFKDHDVPKELVDVTDLAKTLSKDGKKAAEAIVVVAGIHTFSNLETLKPHAANLTERINTLKSLTDSLINLAKADEAKAQTDLTGKLKKLNEEEFGYYATNGVVKAYNSSLQFICEEGQCHPIECVDEICKQLGKNGSEADKSQKGLYTKGDHD